MIIEGNSISTGVINKKSMGYSDEEDVVASAIESLKSAKLEICPACTGKVSITVILITLELNLEIFLKHIETAKILMLK